MASSARIDELKKKFDENPRRYFAPLANEYRKAGQLEQAIEICRTHLADQPGHMSGHIVYGQALFEAGRHDEARRTFETALSLDPENLIALRHLGDIARDAGDRDGALQWYRRVLDADPRNEEILAQIESLAPAGEEREALDTPAIPALDEGGEWPSFAPTPPGTPAVGEEPPAPPPTGTRVMSPAELGIGSVSSEDVAEERVRDDAPIEPGDLSTLPTLEVPAITPEQVPALGVEHTALDTGNAGAGRGEDIPSILDETFPAPAPEPLGFERTSVEMEAFEPTSFAAQETQGEPGAADAHGAATPEPAGFETSGFEATGFEPTSFEGNTIEEAPSAEPAVEPISLDVPGAVDEPPIEPITLDEASAAGRGDVPSYEPPTWEPTDAAATAPDEAPRPGTAGQSDELVFLDDAIPSKPEGRLTAGLPMMYEPEPEEPAAPEPQALGAGPAFDGRAQPDAGDDEHITLEEPAGAPFVTETMAELYLSQGFRDQAISVYRQLAGQRPDDDRLRARLAELEAQVPDAVAEEPVAGGADEVALPSVAAVSAPVDDERRRARAQLPSILDVLRRVAAHRPGEVAADAVGDVATPVEAPAAEPVSAAPVAEPASVATAEPAPAVPAAPSAPAMAAAPSQPVAEPAPTSVAAGSIDALFDGVPSARDEAAARTLASLFADASEEEAAGRAPVAEPVPVSGAPTRPAGDELTLDTVFNEPKAPAASSRRSSSSFSFDQFFAETAPSPAPSAPDAAGSGGAASSGADIEQFNAWLDGLKKK